MLLNMPDITSLPTPQTVNAPNMSKVSEVADGWRETRGDYSVLFTQRKPDARESIRKRATLVTPHILHTPPPCLFSRTSRMKPKHSVAIFAFLR